MPLTAEQLHDLDELIANCARHDIVAISGVTMGPALRELMAERRELLAEREQHWCAGVP